MAIPLLPLPPLSEASFIADAERIFKGVPPDAVKSYSNCRKRPANSAMELCW